MANNTSGEQNIKQQTNNVIYDRRYSLTVAQVISLIKYLK